MTHVSELNSPRSRSPVPSSRTAPEGDDRPAAGSGRIAQSFVAPAPCERAADSGEEAEVGLILEMRYQEYITRRALEELFERGALELLLG